MSEELYSQAEFCHKELLDTREELDNTRRMNEHLNNIVDKQKNTLDGINVTIREVCKGERTESMGFNNIMQKAGYRR